MCTTSDGDDDDGVNDLFHFIVHHSFTRRPNSNEAMATAQCTFGHSRSSICYVWSSGQCDSFNDNNGSSSNNSNASNIIIIRRLVESFLVFCFSSAVVAAADSVSSARFSILRRRKFHALHHEIVFGELCIGCRPLSDAESK